MKKMLLLAVLLCMCGSLCAEILQVPGRTINGRAYVEWQAEDWKNNVINYPTRRAWGNSNAAQFDAGPGYGDGGWYIIANSKGDNISEKNYVTYDIQFTVPGDYLLYQRIGAFNTVQESSCDTMWFNTKGSGYLVNNGGFVPENRIQDPQFGDLWNLVWKRWEWFYIAGGNRIKVTQADLDAGGGVYTFTFMMGAREGGMAHDAMVAVDGATSFAEVSRRDLNDLFMRDKQPWGETPVSGSNGVSITPQLSWKGHITDPNTPEVIDPKVKTFYLYMTNGTADPNLYYVAAIPVNGTSSSASYTVSSALPYLTTYSWRIEEGMDNGSGGVTPAGEPNNPVSDIWTFTTQPANLAPVITAGSDASAWLVDGTASVQLAGQILEDDGWPVAATTTWSIINEPNPLNPAAIDNAALLNATVTMKEAGNYTLLLTTTDTEHTVTDDMVITIYADSCAAAKAVPGFTLLVGDHDEDCQVDIDDFAMMAANWLTSNAL